MSHEVSGPAGLAIPSTFRIVSMVALGIAISAGLFPTWLYSLEHPEFSFFRTYLSDIGDSGGWPEILFNSITLVGAPVRLLVVILLAFRLSQLGGAKGLLATICVVGFVSMVGTILMTAVPFSVAPAVHKTGVPLYFFGAVILQIMIAIQELRLPRIPRLLPALSLLVVLVFFVLFLLLEQGVVGRNTPVFWEWQCLFTSILWLAAHGVLLGDESEGWLRSPP